MWAPTTPLNPRTYMTQIEAVDASGNKVVYGSQRAWVSHYPRAPVIRLQGIDASFARQTYAPGAVGNLRISTDATDSSMESTIHLWG